MYVTHITNKRLVFRKYKELPKIGKKKINNLIEKGVKDKQEIGRGIKNMDIQHMKRYLTGNQGKANKKRQ